MTNKKAKTIVCCLLCVLTVLMLSLACCDSDKSSVLTGEGQPDARKGVDGNYYIDTDTDELYYKDNGEWSLVSVLQYRDNKILLPEIIYACVGQEMEIYFRNIIAYDLDDVLISTGTDMPDCHQFEDKWVGVPQKAGVYALVISLYTKNGQLLNAYRTSIVVKDNAPKKLYALVIGDSTVHGGVETYKMLQLAQNDGTELTLLGTMQIADDNKFEGRVGWQSVHYVKNDRIDDLTNPFFNETTKTFDFTYYMTNQNYEKVDAVFLQLGINDIFHVFEDTIDASINSYVNNLKTMIDSIHAYNPNVKVIVNPIIPCCQSQDEFGKIYGIKPVWTYMRDMYSANLALLKAFSDTPNVYVSQYNASLDLVNQPSNVHPSFEGYEQLGAQMYYYMKAIID